MSDIHAAVEPATKTQSKKKKQPIKVHETEIMMTADHHRCGRIQVMLRPGVKFENVLTPDCWSQVSYKFEAQTRGGRDYAGSFIEVRTEDGAFYALLYVRAVQKNGLLVVCIGPAFNTATGKACAIDLENGEPLTGEKKAVGNANYKTRWAIGKRGWDIIRISDGELVGDGKKFPTPESAQKWIDEAMKVN